MAYEAKNFDELIGIAGLSEDLLKNHFTLYQGYIKNTNGLLGMLDTKESGTPEYSELQRRLGWEWNGMRLHELYFGNLEKDGSEQNLSSELHMHVASQFGSVESWLDSFKKVLMMRGIGWVVLYYDKVADRLFNVWVNEHDVGHLAGCTPILVIDVFEHSYMLDYGTKRDGYIEAVMKAIDWKECEKRFDQA